MGTRFTYSEAEGRWIAYEEPVRISIPWRPIGVVAGVAVVAAILPAAIANFRIVPSPAPAPKPAAKLAIKEPKLGKIRLGAFAQEAAEVAGLRAFATDDFAKPDAYRVYRDSVRQTYGVDLEDMNYLGIGQPGWGDRLDKFEAWLLQAGKYGDVTVALEPLGSGDPFDVFTPSAAMDRLRAAFQRAEDQGITVWLRFASEANDGSCPYHVIGDEYLARSYYKSALWLKASMPENVKLVFCPLINMAVVPTRRQKQALDLMFGGQGPDDGTPPWDCIGGTLYRTDRAVLPTYEGYYRAMNTRMQARGLDLPFEVCELGGAYERRGEITHFLKLAAAGHWARLRKVNLFARDINRVADPRARFGYMDPEARKKAIAAAKSNQSPIRVESWIKPWLASYR